jgi:hypothetical protein
MTNKVFAALCLLLISAGQASAQKWVTLFDGKSTAAWRGYNKPDLPTGWQVVDNALTRVGKPAGDIITRNTYENFELQLEWKISRGGNSGIFFHVKEDTALAVYETGPEMQVLDNAGHNDGKNPLTSAASDFALHAPVRDVTKPVGQWNKARLVVKGPHVEHWLNGVKVVEYELWSDDWKQRVANSKFKAWPGFGMPRSGHIALQDHGDWVAFRKIRIRVF